MSRAGYIVSQRPVPSDRVTVSQEQPRTLSLGHAAAPEGVLEQPQD